MSVVVLGMEMPEDCDSCFVPSSHCNLWLQVDVGSRHEDCPLRPLPEKHGRLIDDSQLREAFGMSKECETCKQDARDCQSISIFTRMDFCGLLDDMTTVFEAEGENDG